MCEECHSFLILNQRLFHTIVKIIHYDSKRGHVIKTFSVKFLSFTLPVVCDKGIFGNHVHGDFLSSVTTNSVKIQNMSVVPHALIHFRYE